MGLEFQNLASMVWNIKVGSNTKGELFNMWGYVWLSFKIFSIFCSLIFNNSIWTIFLFTIFSHLSTILKTLISYFSVYNFCEKCFSWCQIIVMQLTSDIRHLWLEISWDLLPRFSKRNIFFICLFLWIFLSISCILNYANYLSKSLRLIVKFC